MIEMVNMAQAAGVLAQGGAAPPQPESTTILQYIHAGGVIGYFIIAMSVVAFALWIYLTVELRLSRLAPQEDVEALRRMFRDGSLQEAGEYCDRRESANFLTRMFAHALRRCSRSQFGLLEMRSALEEAGQRQVERVYRTCDWVALIAAVGPMLGLLGTVFGMIGAFGSISRLEGAARSQELANFMSLALIATALGLLVAIPSTAAYSIFRRRIDRLAEEIGEIAESLAGELGSRTREASAHPQHRPTPQRLAPDPREARAS